MILITKFLLPEFLGDYGTKVILPEAVDQLLLTLNMHLSFLIQNESLTKLEG